jgi:tetratricopeptide (TPR) repeat protein
MELATQLNDLRGLADGCGVLGWIEEFLGNLQQALTFFKQRLTLSRQLNYQRGIAYALRGLGGVATAQGRYVEANTWLQEALRIFAELGDRRVLAQIWQDLGRLAYHENHVERAEVAFQNSLAIYQEVDDRHYMADLWLDLSRLPLARDDVAVAVAHQEVADRLIQDQARPLAPRGFLHEPGMDFSASTVYFGGETRFGAGAVRFELFHHRAKLVENIDLFAAAAMAEQRPVHALHLWSAAERFRRQMGLLSPVCEARQRQQQMIDALSLQMLADHFISIWQIGQEWSLEQAMAEARSDRTIGRS